MPDIIIIPPGGRLSLSPSSSAFAHGFGLFETMRYADGRLYFWQDHWARLAKSARHFALTFPEQDEVLAALRELAAAIPPGEATLKLSLVKEATESRLYVYSRPPIPAPEGRRLRLDATCPIARSSILAGHKTHNYMEVMHLLSLARAQGYYDALRLNTEGYLAETCSSNLFFLEDGRFHTPSLDTGILPGVIRGAVLSIPGLSFGEGLYTPEILSKADAVFVTNSTGGLQPIEQIDDLPEVGNASYEITSDYYRELAAAFERVSASRAIPLY